MAWRPPLPTLGYPSQSAAIVGLYLDGMQPRAIAEKVGASINSVQRSLSQYRAKNGIPTPERVYPPATVEREPTHPMWDMDEGKRRQEIIKRAAKAARLARLAA